MSLAPKSVPALMEIKPAGSRGSTSGDRRGQIVVDGAELLDAGASWSKHGPWAVHPVLGRPRVAVRARSYRRRGRWYKEPPLPALARGTVILGGEGPVVGREEYGGPSVRRILWDGELVHAARLLGASCV